MAAIASQPNAKGYIIQDKKTNQLVGIISLVNIVIKIVLQNVLLILEQKK